MRRSAGCRLREGWEGKACGSEIRVTFPLTEKYEQTTVSPTGQPLDARKTSAWGDGFLRTLFKGGGGSCQWFRTNHQRDKGIHLPGRRNGAN